MRRAPSFFYAFAMLVITTLPACGGPALHRSYGMVHNALLSTQVAARGARDVPTRGDETDGAIRKYLSHFQADSGVSGGGGARHGTAGVPPLF